MTHAAVVLRRIEEQGESTPCFAGAVEGSRRRGPFPSRHRLHWRRRISGGRKHRDIFDHRTDVVFTQAAFPGRHGRDGYAFASDTAQVILRQIASAQTGATSCGAANAVTIPYGAILCEERLAARDH